MTLDNLVVCLGTTLSGPVSLMVKAACGLLEGFFFVCFGVAWFVWSLCDFGFWKKVLSEVDCS